MAQKKVLFFAPYGLWTVHHQLDAVLATALRLRGAEVLIVTCEGIFDNCPLARKVALACHPYDKSICRQCAHCGRTLFSQFGLPTMPLRSLLSPADIQHCRSWAQSLEPDQLTSACFEGKALGPWVSSHMRSFFVVEQLDLTNPQVVRTYRSMLYNAALLVRAYETLLRRFYPDHVVCFHSMLAFYRVILELSRQRDIPVLVHDRGFIDDSFQFVANERIIDPAGRVAAWQSWKQVPLTIEQCHALKKYFIDRETGINTNFTNFYRYKSDESYVRRQLRIPPDVPLIAFFTSSDWELGQKKHIIRSTFETEIEAIEKIIDVFAAREEYLVIRHHPHIIGNHHTGSSFLSKLFELNRRRPDNVRIVMPNERLTSYAIIWNAEALITYGSTTGIEALARGLSVCSLYNNIYTAIGLGIEMVESPDDLEAAVERALQRTKEFGLEDLRRLYRAAYYLFFRLSYRLKHVGIKDVYIPDIRLKSLDDLAVGKDPTLDLICQHILAGRPLLPVPTEDQRRQSDRQETEFLQQELEAIRQRRTAVRTSPATEHSCPEPAVTVVQIRTDPATAASETFLARTIAKSRHTNIQNLQIHLATPLTSRLLAQQIQAALEQSHGEYLYLATDNTHVDEALFSASVDLLQQPDNAALDGLVIGAWLCDENGELAAEILTERKADRDFDSLNKLTWLADPAQWFALLVWRRQALERFVELLQQDEQPLTTLPALIFQNTIADDAALNFHKIRSPLITIYLSASPSARPSGGPDEPVAQSLVSSSRAAGSPITPPATQQSLQPTDSIVPTGGDSSSSACSCTCTGRDSDRQCISQRSQSPADTSLDPSFIYEHAVALLGRPTPAITATEAKFLIDAVSTLPSNARILEIAPALGRTTIAAASACLGTSRRIYLVRGHEYCYGGEQAGSDGIELADCDDPALLRLRQHVTELGLSVDTLVQHKLAADKFDLLLLHPTGRFDQTDRIFRQVYPLLKDRAPILLIQVHPTQPDMWRLWHQQAKDLLVSPRCRHSLGCGNKPPGSQPRSCADESFSYAAQWAQYLQDGEPELSEACQVTLAASRSARADSGELVTAEQTIAAMPEYCKELLAQMLQTEAAEDVYLQYWFALSQKDTDEESADGFWRQLAQATDPFIRARAQLHSQDRLSRRITPPTQSPPQLAHTQGSDQQLSSVSDRIPIVFIHVDNPPYLKYTLLQARAANPDLPIHLIGQAGNDCYDFVQHHNIDDYAAEALQFANWYEHRSSNPVGFEMFCFQRWFILNRFVKAQKIRRCLYVDSDVLLFCDVDEQARIFSRCDVALNRPMGLHCSFWNNMRLLEDFCNFLMDVYKRRRPEIHQQIVEYYAEITRTGQRGGVTDMLLFDLFLKHHPYRVDGTEQPVDGAVFDHSLCTTEVGPIEFEMHNGIKKLRWQDNQPYGIDARTGQSIRLKSLHCQGNAKDLIKQLCKAAESSSSSPRDVVVPVRRRRSKPRCLFLNTYYQGFLDSHYSRNPQLASACYDQQKASLQQFCFGDSDFYSQGLIKAGWDADDLIINCPALQQAWARENHFAGRGLEIAVEQIRRLKPDVVYIQDLHVATAEFLSAIRPHTRLVVGQIASPLPPQADLASIDIIFSSFPHFVQRFRRMGLTAYYQPLAFEPRVLEKLPELPRKYPVTFVGGLSAAHGKGMQILMALAERIPIDFWGYGAESLPADSPIRKRHHGPVWGLDMFAVLRQSFITINRHIDVAENYANNMRLFEATGCGALLITDYKDNLAELFEISKELVAYRSADEAAALIKYYLDHPEQARRIAQAGQQRTLRDHTYTQRMAQTAEILERHLRYHREKDRFAEPDLSKISYGHRPIDRTEISEQLTKAWQNDQIPSRQRALVQRELAAMYMGRPPLVYQVLARILQNHIRPGDSVLEIGCASGYYYEVLEYLLGKRFRYTGVDYSQALIDMAQDYYPNATFVCADGAKLPFEDNQFDVVISSCVLLHVPDYLRHIAETARVAGRYVVVHRTPVCRRRPTQYYKKFAYGVETVELRFNEDEILSALRDHGLKLVDYIEYHQSPEKDEFELTYLFEKVPAGIRGPLTASADPAASVPSRSARPVPKRSSIRCAFTNGPVVLVSRKIEFTFPLGYAYLAGYLRQQGEKVIVLYKDRPFDELVKQIMALNPVLVGFGTLYPELKEVGDLIRMLDRAGRKFPVVVGGQMVSPTPQFAVKVTGADFGVVGEGEMTLHRLVTALRQGRDPHEIPGLVIRDGDEFISTGPGEYIEDLSNLPPIPYDLFPQEQWLPIGLWYAEHCPQPHWRVEDRVINVHGGRGCPFRCNFCYHHSKPRYRPIDLMMAEAEEALERFDGNMLYFSDDLVLASPARARRLVEGIRSLKRPVEYSVSARFDVLARIDDDLLEEMKHTGCRIMGLGIESGSDRILKLIGKNCTVETIWNGLERLKKVGILPTVSIMVGQYTETRQDVEASIRLVRESLRSNPNINYAFTITTPFPGSPLYNLIFEKGYLKDDQEFYDRYFCTSDKYGQAVGEFKQVVNLSAMSDEEVIEMYNKICRVYREERPKYFKRTVGTIQASPQIFYEQYELPFIVDKIMLSPENEIVVRCVTELPAGLPTDSPDASSTLGHVDYGQYFRGRFLDDLLGAAAKVFPDVHAKYTDRASLQLRPYQRKNFPHQYFADGKLFQWYVLHPAGKAAATQRGCDRRIPVTFPSIQDHQRQQ